jgi:hypothetical protein
MTGNRFQRYRCLTIQNDSFSCMKQGQFTELPFFGMSVLPFILPHKGFGVEVNILFKQRKRNLFVIYIPIIE